MSKSSESSPWLPPRAVRAMRARFLIALSCKGVRRVPACNARRMVATAAHLTDHVLADLPLRQWVLAEPKRLGYFLEFDAALQGSTGTAASTA